MSSGSMVLTQDQIRDIFDFYANFGRSSVMSVQETLDSFMFMKFTRECPNLMDKKLNRTEVDLIFTKAKPKGYRRLSFDHFLDALSAFSSVKYPDKDPAQALRLLLVNHLVPHYHIVQEELARTGDDLVPLPEVFRRLHDVRSYTGVYAERFRSGDGRINGEADNRVGRSYVGNTNTGTDEVFHDISVIMRPHLQKGGTAFYTKQEMRGRSSSPRRNGGRSPSPRGRPSSPKRSAATPRGRSPRRVEPPPLPEPAAPAAPKVKPVISSAEADRMSGELLSALASARSGNPSTLLSLTSGLLAQLTHVADENESLRAELAAPVTPARDSGGGVGAGAEPGRPVAEIEVELAKVRDTITRFNDRIAAEDPSSDFRKDFEMALDHAQSRRAELERQLYYAQTAAAARPPPPPSASSPYTPAERAKSPMRAGEVTPSPARRNGGGKRPKSTKGKKKPMPEIDPTRTLTKDQIEEIFTFYAHFGRSTVQSDTDSLDSFMFMKFCRECPGLIEGGVDRTSVDLTFTKAKPKGARRLNFNHFLDALSALSEKRYPDDDAGTALRKLVTYHLVPLLDLVQAEMAKTGEDAVPLPEVFRRLHDVRSYTGVYAERFRSGDGRINGEADNRAGTTYAGDTNTGTDEIYHDISVFMRPHLRKGSMMGAPGSPGPRRSASPRRTTMR